MVRSIGSTWRRRRSRPSVPPVPDAWPEADAPTRATLIDPIAEAELTTFGFTVIRALDPAAVAAARALHEELGAAPDDPQVAINWSFHSQSLDYKAEVHARLVEVAGGPVGALLDRQVPYLASYITKWPGSNGAFPPHQDPSLVDERRFRGVTVWMALEPVGLDGVDNGVLRFVPGSHRFWPSLRPSNVDAFPFAAHEEAILRDHGVGIGLEPGEAIVFDNRVIHYSLPNRTDRPRVVASFGVRPAEARCVLLRAAEGPDRWNIHEIDDDYYLRVLPAHMHAYQPPNPPIGEVVVSSPAWSPEQFAARCRAAADLPASARRPIRSTDVSSDPQAFCAYCGATQGFDIDIRAQRNNAQLVCDECAVALQL